MMTVFGILTFILDILLGGFVIFKKRRLQNITLGIFAITLGIWGFSIFLTTHTSFFDFWGRVAFFSSIFAAGSVFLFSLVFPENKTLAPITIALVSLPALFLSISSFTPLLIKSVSVSGANISGTFGPAIILYNIFIPGYILGAIILLIIKYFRIQNGFQKLQLKYVLLGVALFLIPSATTNLILPRFFGISDFNTMGPLFSVFLVGFTTYAIMKHQLMDIRVVIQRGIIYTILLMIIMGFYLSMIFLVGFLFGQRSDIAILGGAAITTILGIFGAPIIEKVFRKITDHIFFKDKYDFWSVINALTEVLNKTLESSEIVLRASEILRGTFKTNIAGIILFPQNTLIAADGDAEWIETYFPEDIARFLANSHRTIVQAEIPYILRQERLTEQERKGLERVQDHNRGFLIEVIVPVMLDRRVIACIIVGKKFSGDIYTMEDIRLLRMFSGQCAIALEKAHLYEKVRADARSLEERVKERTAEIQQLQEDRSRLMVEISHALQTPLTVVKAELGFLKTNLPENPQLSAFERSIDEISKFIYDLLYLSILETKQGAYTKTPVHLSDIATGLVGYFSVMAEQQHINFKGHIEPNIVIEGDAKKLEELIMNLVSNAIKYTAVKKNGRVSLTLKRAGRGTIKIIVTDTGIGISKEDIPKIFNRFYRVKNAPYDIKGTGLGLSIAQNIAEHHGGTIAVKSTLGKGSEFTITLKMKSGAKTRTKRTRA